MKIKKDLNNQKFKRHHREITAIKTRARICGAQKWRSNLWTEEEDEILKKYYLIEGADCIKRLPRHNTIVAIKSRAQALKIGLSGINRNPWAEEELAILKEYYPLMGRHCVQVLPGRTEQNLSCKAIRLGLEKKVFEWTEEYKKYLYNIIQLKVWQ